MRSSCCRLAWQKHNCSSIRHVQVALWQVWIASIGLMMTNVNTCKWNTPWFHSSYWPKSIYNNDWQRGRGEKRYRDALLVCDGFLVPTKDRGGLYVITNPGHESETTVCLTNKNQHHRWFYHRAVWLDLTGDRRQSILTARCKVSSVLNNRKNGGGIVTSGITKTGQLVWLECPKPHSYSATGTPLERDGKTELDPFSSIISGRKRFASITGTVLGADRKPVGML